LKNIFGQGSQLPPEPSPGGTGYYVFTLNTASIVTQDLRLETNASSKSQSLLFHVDDDTNYYIIHVWPAADGWPLMCV